MKQIDVNGKLTSLPAPPPTKKTNNTPETLFLRSPLYVDIFSTLFYVIPAETLRFFKSIYKIRWRVKLWISHLEESGLNSIQLFAMTTS